MPSLQTRMLACAAGWLSGNRQPILNGQDINATCLQSYVRIDGSVPAVKRDIAVTKFQNGEVGGAGMTCGLCRCRIWCNVLMGHYACPINVTLLVTCLPAVAVGEEDVGHGSSSLKSVLLLRYSTMAGTAACAGPGCNSVHQGCRGGADAQQSGGSHVCRDDMGKRSTWLPGALLWICWG